MEADHFRRDGSKRISDGNLNRKSQAPLTPDLWQANQPVLNQAYSAAGSSVWDEACELRNLVVATAAKTPELSTDTIKGLARGDLVNERALNTWREVTSLCPHSLEKRSLDCLFQKKLH